MKFMGRLFQFISVLWFGFGVYIIIEENAVRDINMAIQHQDWMWLVYILFICFLLIGLPVIFVFLGQAMVRSGKLKKENKELKKQVEQLKSRSVTADVGSVSAAPSVSVASSVSTAPAASTAPSASDDFEAYLQAVLAEVPAPAAVQDPRTAEREWARAERREKVSRAAKDMSEKAKVLGDSVKASGTITGSSNYSVIAGALFAVLAIIPGFSLLAILGNMGKLGSALKLLPSILLIVANVALYVIAAAQLLRKKTDGLFVAILGIMAALTVLSFVTGFFTKSYEAYYYSYRNSEYKFNLFCTLPTLLEVVGYVSLFALAVIHGTDFAPQYREKTGKLWYFPAACVLGGFLLPILFVLMETMGLIRWIMVRDIWNIGTWFSTAIRIAAILFAGMWITNPDGLPKAEVIPEEECGESELPWAAYYDLFKHTLFMMITFGIYTLIWIFRTTRNLNCVKGEPPRTPWKKLLLCLFIPFYLPYWVYKSAQRVDKLAEAAKVPGRMEAVCLIMGFFMPAVAFILLQDRMNCILKAQRKNAVRTAPSVERLEL